VALFLGKISPSGDPKKGPYKSYREFSFYENGTNSAYFKEKKVKFATFRP
jgi:hypothetical protein